MTKKQERKQQQQKTNKTRTAGIVFPVEIN